MAVVRVPTRHLGLSAAATTKAAAVVEGHPSTLSAGQLHDAGLSKDDALSLLFGLEGHRLGRIVVDRGCLDAGGWHQIDRFDISAAGFPPRPDVCPECGAAITDDTVGFRFELVDAQPFALVW